MSRRQFQRDKLYVVALCVSGEVISFRTTGEVTKDIYKKLTTPPYDDNQLYDVPDADSGQDSCLCIDLRLVSRMTIKPDLRKEEETDNESKIIKPGDYNNPVN